MAATWVPDQRRSQRAAVAPQVSAQQRRDAPVRTALDRGLLSIRGVDRTLRVAWSLADLAGRTSPGIDEVAAALSFRQTGARR